MYSKMRFQVNDTKRPSMRSAKSKLKFMMKLVGLLVDLTSYCISDCHGKQKTVGSIGSHSSLMILPTLPFDMSMMPIICGHLEIKQQHFVRGAMNSQIKHYQAGKILHFCHQHFYHKFWKQR